MNNITRRLMFLGPLGLLAVGGGAGALLLQRMSEGSFDPRGVPSVLINKPVPKFSLASQAGHPGFDQTALTAAGHPILVNFFASWCLPCIAEAPQLLALQKRSLQIWGVAYKDKEENTARFLAQHGNPFTRVARDPDGNAALEFGVYGVPETYLIDKTGIIRWRWVGALSDSVIARALDPLLAKYA